MPINPLVAAAAIGALGNGAGVFAQGKMNKKTREWNEKMYHWQRRDALSDWNMQNAYNAPDAQMARLGAAGLNPHLIYGKGAGDMTSGLVRSSDAKAWNPKAPDYGAVVSGAGNALMQYMDTRVKEGQVNNLQEQNKLLGAQVLESSARTAKTLGETAKTAFDLKLAQSLERNTLEVANENLRKLRTSTDIMLTQEQRNVALHAPSLAKAVQEVVNLKTANAKSYAEIANIQANTNNAIRDGKIKDFEIELNKMGLTKGDAVWWRMFEKVMEKLGTTGLPSIPELMREVIPQSGFERGQQKGDKMLKELRKSLRQ